MLKTNLQYFAEENPQEPNNQEPTETPTEPAAEPNKPESDPSKQKEEPNNESEIKTIPYDRFKQVNDEAKQFKDTFKELGIDDTEALKALVSEYQAKKSEEEERRKAEMSEVERLQAEKEEADNKLSDYETRLSETINRANQRLIKSEYTVLAKDFGVRKDALDDAYQALINSSEVEVDDEGNVRGVREAMDKLKQSKAYYFDNHDYKDPSPSNKEPKREDSKKLAEKELKEIEDRIRKYGRIKDKIAYAQKKKEYGL